MTTLLGRDEHPGEIPPWGYIPAPVARDLAARMVSAEWRFVICDDDGRPICSGITTRRPVLSGPGTGPPTSRSQGTSLPIRQGHGTSAPAAPVSRRNPGRRAGIVEVQVRASDLCWLDAAAAEEGCFPEWAQVIADIATRVNVGDVDTDHAAEQVRRRFPTAGLRRLVEVRARYCTHPACRAPASSGDHDHAEEYADGGRTTVANLHPPCRHDHRLRHDGGWRITLAGDGTVSWTSPLGRSYATRPPQVMIDTPKLWNRQVIAERDSQSTATHASDRPKVLDVADDEEPPF